MGDVPAPLRLLLTGGGTGGHIYPALSIAAGVRQRVPGAEILFVGTAEGLEARLVPRAGLPFEAIPARGLAGKGPLVAAGGLAALARGAWRAVRLLRRFRPHVVVGTGGYVSGPVVAAAVLLRIPVALQEQNAFPGATNRLLSRFAGFVAAAYEESRRCFPRRARVVVTGNPVRPEVVRADRHQARRRLGVADAERLVVVFMGSRGSATVNRAMGEALVHLGGRPGLRLLYATGESHYEAVLADLRARGLEVMPGPGSGENRAALAGANVEVRPYLHDMVTALAAADLVVARAGAMTLAEVTARGLPALLIPSPHVAHRHQDANARVLAARGAARVLAEEGLRGEELARAILELAESPALLARMAEASRQLGRPGAVEAIVDGILDLVARAGQTPPRARRR